MKGASLIRFISERKKQDGGNLKRMLKQVLKGGVQGGMSGSKNSRSLSDIRTKPIKGFKQGVKRKAKQVLGREVVKRARDIFGA